MSVIDRLTKTSDFKVVGTRPIRPDGIEKVTGRARFGADMAAPGMLMGAILRSPHPHARILSIDTSKAEALRVSNPLLRQRILRKSATVFATGCTM